MIANRLTKALARAKFNKFSQQVSLIDTANQIREREAKEEGLEELDHNTL